MAKLEIPVVVDISEIESLIDEIKHLQTYKLSYGAEQILVDRDDVVKIFADHVRANIEPERKKGKWIRMSDADGIYYCCSECGEELYRKWSFDRAYDLFPKKESIERTNFCPSCGAQMEVLRDE